MAMGFLTTWMLMMTMMAFQIPKKQVQKTVTMTA